MINNLICKTVFLNHLSNWYWKRQFYRLFEELHKYDRFNL